MPNQPRKFQHFFLPSNGIPEPFTSPRPGGSKKVPYRNTSQQYRKLTAQLRSAYQSAHAVRAEMRDPQLAIGQPGVYLDFVIPSKYFAPDRIELPGVNVELVSAHPLPTGDTRATLFVPDSAGNVYQERLDQYKTRRTTKKGLPYHQPLIDSIDQIALASLASLWSERDPFPKPDEIRWWEVWLRSGTVENYLEVAGRLEILTSSEFLRFPAREVRLCRATARQLGRVLLNCDALAELNSGEKQFNVPTRLGLSDVGKKVQDYAALLKAPALDAPAVLVLDSGVTNAHDLLRIAIADDDVQTVDSAVSAADWNSHGSGMAGLCLHGDLRALPEEDGPITLQHRAESVLIFHPNLQTGDDRRLLGTTIPQAISLAEIQAPHRSRVSCLAVTLRETCVGTPSTLSAAIDQLASDVDHRRLFVVSAGNIRAGLSPKDYPALNDRSPIEDPAQSWNAITIGAYTEIDTIQDKRYSGWSVVAKSGDICPSSRTSMIWDSQWPYKPDILFEGGNAASQDGVTATELADLAMVTTHNSASHLQPFGATSGATALAGRFAASLMAAHPEFWPETVRALMVHSASWTAAMEDRISAEGLAPAQALRRYGFGVPNIERALRSAKDDLTIIFQKTITPFRVEDQDVKSRELIFHALPLPTRELLALKETNVELRVTLSYFVEPNPASRGFARRYTYGSHGLRFELKRESESEREFRARTNKQAQGLDYTSRKRPTDPWKFKNLRNKGSLHSDVIEMTAASLATRDAIVVFPVGGWWREMRSERKEESETRYALVVTLRVLDDVDVDIYTPIATLIKQEIATT